MLHPTRTQIPSHAQHDAPVQRRWHHLKDPFPAWSHWVGALLSVAAAAALIVESAGSRLRVVAFGVYGTSLVLLYFASALAHSIHCSPSAASRLDRFDYAAIFIVIAGTYTPLCLITLYGRWGIALLVAVWATAAVGITTVYCVRSRLHWPRVLCYVAMGWLGVCAAGPLIHVLPVTAIGWLIGGGVIYTVGALVFLSGRPRLWPGTFGSHDLWHCMVIAGSACHYVLIFKYVAALA